MDTAQLLRNLQLSELNQMQKSTVELWKKNSDIILLSPTGSGKTLAFLMSLVQKFEADHRGVQAAILVPSRELALQIEQVFKKMSSGFRISVCYGGHSKKTEENELAQTPALLVGTPGRVAYHVRSGNFDASTVKMLVLDEFDKALELGFEEDMSFILSAMSGLTQKLLTSATEMRHIPAFAKTQNAATLNFLKSGAALPALTFKKVETTAEEKLETLFHLLCCIGEKRCLIFCNHRDAAERISELLRTKGLARETFHGGMEQDARERALLKFRNDSCRILITTDLASRGLDIPEVESIVHYQLPPKEDAFIHRNGRTARMKAEGTVYLIMTEEENFPFLDKKLEEAKLPKDCPIPGPTPYSTVYFSLGKKDKVNKVDLVGFLIKQGGLAKEDVGLIEVKDNAIYAAIRRSKVPALLPKINGQKLKNKKVKTEVAQ